RSPAACTVTGVPGKHQRRRFEARAGVARPRCLAVEQRLRKILWYEELERLWLDRHLHLAEWFRFFAVSRPDLVVDVHRKSLPLHLEMRTLPGFELCRP